MTGYQAQLQPLIGETANSKVWKWQIGDNQDKSDDDENDDDETHVRNNEGTVAPVWNSCAGIMKEQLRRSSYDGLAWYHGEVRQGPQVAGAERSEAATAGFDRTWSDRTSV